MPFMNETANTTENSNQTQESKTDVVESKRAYAIQLFKKYSSVFLALGDEFRQKVIIELAEHPEGKNVTEINENKTLSRPAISYHLKVLKDCGIVTTKKKATQVYYFLNFDDFFPKLKEFFDALFDLRRAVINAEDSED